MKNINYNQPKFWIGVASKDHVKTGSTQGFAQFCHGKLGPAKKVKKGDLIIYYSSKEKYQGSTPLQKFTAIGMILDDSPYQFEMSPGFKPFRRGVEYFECNEVEIRPMINELQFIKDKQHWGAIFRYGFFEIDNESFKQIAKKMLLEKYDEILRGLK